MKPHTTIESLAALPDVIAAYRFNIADHRAPVLAEEAGPMPEVWRLAAQHLASLGEVCLEGDTASAHIGDAQSLRYLRSGKHAVVVVLTTGGKGNKSVLRSMRRHLATVALAERSTAAHAEDMSSLARSMGAMGVG